MEREKFNALRENYEKYISQAENAINGDKAIEQTKSVWFDRKTLQSLLDQTDETTGGIKIYFGMYDQDTTSERDTADRSEDYIGKLTLILTASNKNEDQEEVSKIINGGRICPPDC